VQEKRKKVAAETATMKQRLTKLNAGVEDNDADLEKLRKSSILYIKEEVNSYSLGRELEYSTQCRARKLLREDERSGCIE
jgi:hypothetical protein